MGVEMTAPLVDSLALSEATSLAVAVGIGVAFGWTLERAGLGNARKLAGQFYLSDLTVFKVMFSAVITAMLGAFWLARLGVLDLERVYVPETWIVAQLAGGLLFGIGFALAALCPGTSCVAAATGRLDGLTTVAGMLVGVWIAGVFIGALSPVYEATARGTVTLPDAFGVSYGVVVFTVVLMALAGFRVAEWIERRR
jgi:uncharacterized membrane protein YedE/YeeE